MKTADTILYDGVADDYVINGKPLLQHLKVHEGVNPSEHMPAILSQSKTCDRLLGNSESDLIGGNVAIYLCGHCGDYDGNPIGVRVVVEDSTVAWKAIGFYSDYEDGCEITFSKVREYLFDRKDYTKTVENMRIYEPAEPAYK